MANDVDMVAVDSSQLAEVGYDAESRTMRCRFTRGQLYEYAEVPEQTYQGLLSAPSVGQFFNQNVKYSFQYKKLE